MTLSEFRALLRLTLADATAWPDATLDRWIGSAIRMYSAHFPRRLRATLALSAGTQAYAVPGGAGCLGVISVEYPTGSVPGGETPPRFLRCVAEWSDLFARGGPCYAVRGGVTGGDGVDDDAPAVGYIVFAEPVADGQSAMVEYWGPHPVPEVGADAAAITVPEQHIEALEAYVDFAAHYELETDEAVVADGSTIVLAQLGEESRRAWNRYKEVMDRLAWLGGREDGALQVSWGRVRVVAPHDETSEVSQTSEVWWAARGLGTAGGPSKEVT